MINIYQFVLCYMIFMNTIEKELYQHDLYACNQAKLAAQHILFV